MACNGLKKGSFHLFSKKRKHTSTDTKSRQTTPQCAAPPWVRFMPSLAQHIPTLTATQGLNKRATPTTGLADPCTNT